MKSLGVPSHAVFAVTTLLLLGHCSALGSFRGGQQQYAQPAAQVEEGDCEGLSKVARLRARSFPAGTQSAGSLLAAPAFSCLVAAGSAGGVSDGSSATCSPVCAEALDVVVVLGASEWSLEEADVAEFRRSALDLLTHFALSRARGSLFGFIDVSHGARSAVKVAALSDDRKGLMAALQAWKPLIGGKPVTQLEMQGFEQRPEAAAMLDVSRPSVRRTLLVLQPPAIVKAHGGPVKQPASHLGLVQTARPDPFKRDKEIMELLVAACPAVRIDPELACGRMRWGQAESNGHDEIKPWGDGSK